MCCQRRSWVRPALEAWTDLVPNIIPLVYPRSPVALLPATFAPAALAIGPEGISKSPASSRTVGSSCFHPHLVISAA